MNAQDVAIRFDRVTKTYPGYYHVTGGIKSFLFNLGQSLRELRRRSLALKDISLEIRRGETFGFIGRNGAGKSTTLGLIAGVLFPDNGAIEVNGRVSPLLELGAGFHPELTGRENIRLNGVLLGLRAAEVEEKLEEIIEFSTLGRFIDQPVRTYSSGMYAKLGFSVVATLKPEILLIDEILSVGDYAFTQRCTERMEKFRADPAVTMVLVSHALDSVSALCDRAAWIEDHAIRMVGPADEVVRAYSEAANQTALTAVPAAIGQLPPHLAPSREELRFTEAATQLDVTPVNAGPDLHLSVAMLAADSGQVVQRWDLPPAKTPLHLDFLYDAGRISLSLDGCEVPALPAPGAADAVDPQAPLVLELVLANARDERACLPALLPVGLSREAMVQHQLRRYAALSPLRHGAPAGAFRSPGQAPLWTTRRCVRVLARTVNPREAEGQFALDVAGFFLSAGVEVRLYAHAAPLELCGAVQPVGRLKLDARPEDVLFHLFGLEDEFLSLAASLPCKKVLYHRALPRAEALRPLDPALAGLLERAREALPGCRAFDAVLADSAAGLEELAGDLREDAYRALCPPLLAPGPAEATRAEAAEARGEQLWEALAAVLNR